MGGCFSRLMPKKKASPPSQPKNGSTNNNASSGTTAPAGPGATERAPDTTPTTTFTLTNSSNSGNVNAYITGSAINNNNALALLQSDGQTVYYPPNPSATQSPVGANISIPLGAPGATKTVTVPQLAGARLWFCIDDTLTFYLNPGPNGPALVEPSVNNPSDPDINKNWGFCEFTYNAQQLFVNISYVDFVSIPISLTLTNTANQTQHVSGMDANGLNAIASGLRSQQAQDNAGWANLIVTKGDGSVLRVLSPNSGLVGNGNLFANYWTDYVNQVWDKYTSSKLTINTQAGAGNVEGQVVNGALDFGNGIKFSKPSGSDIFSNSTGPFATSASMTQEQLAIIPRLAAAFNRSTMLTSATQPDGAPENTFYTASPTNHYSRVVHSANLDGKGYAFPYDDVTPDGAAGIAGTVFDGSPQVLNVAVGGNGAHA